MKKFAILLVTLLVLTTVTLAGCTPADVPGTAWAQKEILTYAVTQKAADSDNEGVEIGVAVSTLERVSGTVKMLYAEGKEFTVAANSTHFWMETKDTDGNVIMRSEFIMNGFTPVASYKMVKFGKKDYFYSGNYNGSKYEYTYQDNTSGATRTDNISAKGLYMDNEFMFMYIRCYAFESGFSKSINILDPVNDSYEAMSVKTEKTGTFQFKKPGEETATEVKTTGIVISRTTVPIGKSMRVYYTNFAEDTDLNLGSSSKRDYHIPVVIEENDIVYLLQSELTQVFTSAER